MTAAVQAATISRMPRFIHIGCGGFLLRFLLKIEYVKYQIYSKKFVYFRQSILRAMHTMA